jgi:hypothetical protein
VESTVILYTITGKQKTNFSVGSQALELTSSDETLFRGARY